MKTENSLGTRAQMNEKFQAIQERVGETARNVSRTTDEYVHENPWKTIAMVAAAALIVGLLLGNRD